MKETNRCEGLCDAPADPLLASCLLAPLRSVDPGVKPPLSSSLQHFSTTKCLTGGRGSAGCRPALHTHMNRPLYVASAASLADLVPLVIHSHFHGGDAGGRRERGDEETRRRDARLDKEASFL